MFILQTERNNICRLEFLIPQSALIRSLAKIMKGAMIYDDERIIRFKCSCIRRLGEKRLTYNESLLFIWCIATQLKFLISEKNQSFYTFRMENIWRMDDKFVYIDDLMDVDDSGIICITHLINKEDVFLSPELKLADRVPFGVHYKTIYYSFGKLLQTVGDSSLDVKECLLEDSEKRAIRFP
jgi:hypothetical protein